MRDITNDLSFAYVAKTQIRQHVVHLMLSFLHITKTCLCNIQRFFMGVKNCNFQMKNCDNFLICAQNIDCGYTLEPPQ